MDRLSRGVGTCNDMKVRGRGGYTARGVGKSCYILKAVACSEGWPTQDGLFLEQGCPGGMREEEL